MRVGLGSGGTWGVHDDGHADQAHEGAEDVVAVGTEAVEGHAPHEGASDEESAVGGEDTAEVRGGMTGGDEDQARATTTEGKPLKEYVESLEKMLIDNTMRRHKGSIVAVMEELCLPRRTLNEKMAKYSLQRSDYV